VGPPLLKTTASKAESGLYSKAFAAILAEPAPAPIPAPVEANRTVHARQKPISEGWGHIAALGWLTMLSVSAASWYAVVDPVWTTLITIPSTTTPHIRPARMASLPIEGATLLLDVVRATAAGDERALEAIDTFAQRPSEMGVNTAVDSTAATVSTHRPAPELIASPVKSAQNDFDIQPPIAKDAIGTRPGDDLGKAVTGRNGEAKGAMENPFVDLYAEEPQSGPTITTASRAETAASQLGDSPSSSSPPGPHPVDAAPSGKGQGKKETKGEKPGPGKSTAAEGRGPKAGKDKPSIGKSAPAGPKDNHNLSGGKPSPEKADQKEKGDADKKDKDKPGKDKPGKDKSDKAKGKGPH
jgi:hypothetical protein